MNYRNIARYFRDQTILFRLAVYIADFGTHAHTAFLGALKRAGFHVVSKPIKNIGSTRGPSDRKANFDVEIAVNAMEWLEEYDTLVLFSGDSDFADLLRALQSRSRQVIVCAFRHTVARELRAKANLYLDVSELQAGALDWGG